MKTSNVISSLLFGSLAAAIPVRHLAPRDLVTKTEVVVETVVIYTTIYDGEVPVAEATSTPGLFYEQPTKQPAAPPAEPTRVAPPQNTPQPEAPKPSTKAPAPEPTSIYTPPPPPPQSTPKPEAPKPSSVTPPAPVVPSPEPVSSKAPEYTPPTVPVKPPTGGGSSHTGEITIYDNPTGAAGACGEVINESDMVVALAKSAWGESTYDVMTGEATNPWCGKKIAITYEGNTIEATIMDMCPGCQGGFDVDLSPAAWNKLTDNAAYGRLEGSWSEM